MENKLKKLIESAIKAPSGHNTQPWKFKIVDNTIQIHPDFSRSLPVVDADHHALYISLGCAAENMLIASTHEGLDAKVEFVKDQEGTEYISIDFTPNGPVEPDGLFDWIEKRQSTKNKYTDRPVPDDDLDQLRRSFDFEGISFLTITNKEEIEKLTPLIIEGSNRQFENRAFVKELISWIRFSKKEALQAKDGVWAASMGMPGVGRWIGGIVMGNLVSAKSEAKRWEGLIGASAGLALFVSQENDVRHWVSLGRALQRYGLTATRLSISHAHMNMPCEEIEVREKLARHLELGDKHPLLLLRFGYSSPMPYSYRRDAKAVIVE